MARAGWSIDGRRIEFHPSAFGGGKLIIDGDNDSPVKVAAKGSTAFSVGTRQLTFALKQAALQPVPELAAASGQLIPTSPKHVAPTKPPPTSSCATHVGAPAEIACARCGGFACDACTGPDGTHCATCLNAKSAELEKNNAALAYAAPAVIFFAMGGVLGALLGGGAAAAAVAIAKRTQSRPTKVGAAVGLYLLAALLYLGIVGALQLAKGQ